MVLDRQKVHDGEYQHLKLKNGLLYKDQLLYVPNSPALRTTRLQVAHDLPIIGHLGYDKTLSVLQRTWWWSNMDKDVRQFVRPCDIC